MARRIWTAEEFEQMTPGEQDAIFRDSIIWNLDDAPPEVLARARKKIERRIAEAETTDTS